MTTIFVVDDDLFVMSLLRTVLVRDGYRVLEAKTAGEAFAVAESYDGPIHLLITDHILQNFRGRDVAERIRATHPAMRVLQLSGIAGIRLFGRD
jgi:DNA-binding NtrC family response regulator